MQTAVQASIILNQQYSYDQLWNNIYAEIEEEKGKQPRLLPEIL